VRVVVDLGLCQGHGVCESEAPAVFRVGKETNTVEVIDTSPPDDLRAEVEAAVKFCPTGALSLEED
jgi:ferredoxin